MANSKDKGKDGKTTKDRGVTFKSGKVNRRREEKIEAAQALNMPSPAKSLERYNHRRSG